MHKNSQILNMKVKTIKLVEENIGEYLSNIA